jgi:GNAT superfamily N-acetyltransferase
MHTIRDATRPDLPFMREILYEAAAVGWTLRGEAPPPIDEVLAHPSNTRYIDGWGREGDAGVVAEDAARAKLGAAWFRIFSAAERGDGIVAEQGVPEIAIAVAATARGRGVGEALIVALKQVARDGGYAALDLSVDPANPARRLYARCGFIELPAGNPHAGGSVLMRCELEVMGRES